VLLKFTNVMNSKNCARAPTPENTTTKRPRTSLTLQTPRRIAKRARRYVGMRKNIQLKSIIFASAYIVLYLLWLTAVRTFEFQYFRLSTTNNYKEKFVILKSIGIMVITKVVAYTCRYSSRLSIAIFFSL